MTEQTMTIFLAKDREQAREAAAERGIHSELWKYARDPHLLHAYADRNPPFEFVVLEGFSDRDDWEEIYHIAISAGTEVQ